MKKVLIIFMIMFALSSCSAPPENNTNQSNQNVQNNTSPAYTIKDFYPFNENIRMKYAGKGNEYAEKDVYVDYISGDRIQLRIINPGTTVAQVIENKEGELRLISSTGEFYYRENIINSTPSKPQDILLKEPIKVGNSWALPDGRKRTITNMNADIQTPSGSYKGIEVTTEGDTYKTYDYYVQNIGLVKSLFKTNDSEVETSLEKIDKSAVVQQTIKFYYPDFNNNRLVFIRDKVSFKTNDDPIKIFEDHLKNPPDKNISRIMSPKTKINKLYLNSEEYKVYIDFSKEFITEMNAGSSLEAMILDSVADTFADYYNVDKVYISIDGKPYASGHFEFGPKDSIYVNYKNVVEYK